MKRLLAFSLFYLLVLVTPLVLGFVLSGPEQLAPRPFRDDLASGLAMMAFAAVLLEFFLLGRCRPVSWVLGSDFAMQAHQLFARTALVFLLLHPLLYSLWGRWPLPWDPTYAQALRISGESWGLFTGMVALGTLVAMVMMAVFRSGQDHDRWRLWHGVLALTVLGLGLHHTLVSGRYAQLGMLRGFWWTLALLALASWLSVYVLRPLLQARRPYRLARVVPLARKIWAVEVAPAGGKPMPFAPGQFVWLKVGRLAPHKDHPFSISSAPQPSGALRLVVKEAGDFTQALPRLQAATPAYVDGPYGNFRIPRQAQAVIMMAGGIGIAPFLGLLCACVQQGERRPVRLIYAERDVTQMVDVNALCGGASLADFRQYLMVEKPDAGWPGLVGRLDARGLELALSREGVAELADTAHFMVCGPAAMMDGVETALLARGVPPHRVQAEHFQYDFDGRSPSATTMRRGWLTLSLSLLVLAGWLAAAS